MSSFVAVMILITVFWTSIWVEEWISKLLKEKITKPFDEKIEDLLSNCIPEKRYVAEIYFTKTGLVDLREAIFAKTAKNRHGYEKKLMLVAKEVVVDKRSLETLENEGPKLALRFFGYFRIIFFIILFFCFFVFFAFLADKPFKHIVRQETLASAKVADELVYEKITDLNDVVARLSSPNASVTEIKTLADKVAILTVEVEDLLRERSEANTFLAEQLQKKEAEFSLKLQETEYLKSQSESQLEILNRIIFNQSSTTSLFFWLLGILMSVPLYWLNRWLERFFKNRFFSKTKTGSK